MDLLVLKIRRKSSYHIAIKFFLGELGCALRIHGCAPRIACCILKDLPLIPKYSMLIPKDSILNT